jgi:hypothetical protein
LGKFSPSQQKFIIDISNQMLVYDYCCRVSGEPVAR